MTLIPHFALPFRIDGVRGAVVHEQDSEEEIMDCIETILRFDTGHRPERPEFGIPDQTFAMPEPDVTLVEAALVEWEPRIEMDVSPPVLDRLDQLITKIRVMRNV
jgi:phage baseplate assembly protein W